MNIGVTGTEIDIGVTNTKNDIDIIDEAVYLILPYLQIFLLLF